MLGRTKKIHFVGIGGIGMSGIAELLLNQGYDISGSDLNSTKITKHLISKGAIITKGHDAKLLIDVDCVVKSSAVQNDNPEIAAALSQKIPVIRRAEMLSELMRMSFGIGIAGTSILGIIIFDEPIEVLKILFILMILLAIVGLKIISN